MNLNRNDLIQQLVDKYRYTKQAATDLVDDFTGIVLENMEAGNTISLYGFGCFDILERKAHRCTNPRTGEPCEVPAHWIPRFYPGKRMRIAVKKWEDNQARRCIDGYSAEA